MPGSGKARYYARFCILAVLTLTAAGIAARDALANAYARRAPAFALRVDPLDPRALATKFDTRLMAGNNPKPLTDGDLVAIRNSLRSNPVQPALLRLLAIGAESSGKSEEAGALITLAERTSRREMLSQLWMIENAVRLGNVKQALTHYDIAFTTSKAAQPLLLQVLTSALDEPEIRDAVAPYLAARRPWRRAFLAYATANAKPADVAAMLTTARVIADPEILDIQRDLLSRFVAAADVRGAQQHALQIPPANPARFNTAGFTPDTVDPAFQPLTWTLSNNGQVEASLDDANHLQIRVAPGAQGVAAARVMHLAAGTFDFVQHVTFIDAAPAFARWEWHCIGSKPGKLWENEIPIRLGSATYRSEVTVPAACNGVQMLLTLTGADGQDYTGMTVERLKIVPTSARAQRRSAGNDSGT